MTVDYRDEELCIEVIDDGRGGQRSRAPGSASLGMRERVALLDGEFTAGPRPEGGFRVAARLPLPARAGGAAAVTAGDDPCVVLADDQPLIRAGLRVLIADCPTTSRSSARPAPAPRRSGWPARPGPTWW